MAQTGDQFSMPPIERASRPMPSKTSPTPFMTPCAVPHDANNPATSIDATNFFMISAPYFEPRLADCVARAKSLLGHVKMTCASGASQAADNGVLWVGGVAAFKNFGNLGDRTTYQDLVLYS